MGRIYAVNFNEVAVSVQQDLFQIEAQTTPAILHAIYLSQSTEEGDAEAENLNVIIQRVTDAVTDDLNAVALVGGDTAENANLAINETSELTTGASIIHAESWNVAQSFIYLPPPELRPIVQIGNAIVVNLNNTPTDAITMSGTMYFEEIGN